MPRLRPSAYVLPLFVGALALLASVFGWLGWRLLEHERDLARQRVQQRLEIAADLAVATLQRGLAELGSDLAALNAVPSADLREAAGALASRLGPSARLVLVDAGALDVLPAGGLPYYPALPADEEADGVFAVAEALEFTRRDPAAAIQALKPLAVSRDARVRAGALLRLGRSFQKLQQPREALSTYDALAALGETPLAGLPAGLVARYARGELLERAGEADALAREARALEAELRAGRWRIDRATFHFYSDAVRRWLALPDAASLDEPPAEAVADAVDLLWTEWRAIERGAGRLAGGQAVGEGDAALMMLWRAAPGRLAGIVGDAALARRHWLPEAVPPDGGGVHVALLPPDRPAPARQAAGAEPARAVRLAAATGLPWSVLATGDPQAAETELAPRRRLILGGLAMVAGVLLASAYAIGRGVTREIGAARLQSEFVAAVSHDFRTPLTSMRQVAELLAAGRVRSDERRATYYALLQSESARLHRLVESLLDFARAEVGARQYRRDRLDIVRLVAQTVEAFRIEAAERGYEIAADGPGEGLAVHGDAEALDRALWNLLDNAVKYSPQCRTVRVGIGVQDGCAVVAVRDGGVGLAPGEHDAIFGKFVRGEAAQTTGAKGTGLGLAMVRHIVEGHGGTIRAASGPEGGSTFTIALPLAAGEDHA